MLTKYDEYPIHQAVRPFSEIPSTDLGWNDGYYFAIFNPELKIKLFWCLRVHPNSDVVHAWAGFVRNDRQRTVRFSRAWRPDCDTVIGPYGIDFIEAYRRIRLSLDANDSGYGFDLEWLGIAPPHEEDRRVFSENGRRVTDQLRYVQEGTARGWVRDRWGTHGSQSRCGLGGVSGSLLGHLLHQSPDTAGSEMVSAQGENPRFRTQCARRAGAPGLHDLEQHSDGYAFGDFTGSTKTRTA